MVQHITTIRLDLPPYIGVLNKCTPFCVLIVSWELGFEYYIFSAFVYFVIIFESSNKWSSFANHGVEFWSTSPILEHYVYYRIYFSKTRKIRMDVIIDFFPSHCEILYSLSISITTQAAIYLTRVLSGLSPSTIYYR